MNHLFVSIFLCYIRFIGVLVYASKWNLFWQVNKTVALILTYIYSCINPFALYFLSSTFRHFYKSYLCCGPKMIYRLKRRTRKHQQQWQSTQELADISDHKRRSSINNTATTISDHLNRIKILSNHQQQKL